MMPKAELTALVEDLDRSAALFVAVSNFHDHYDSCAACHCEQTALCPEGNRLNEIAAKLRTELTDTACSPDAKGETHRAHRDPCAFGSTPDLTSRGGVGPLTH